MSSRIDRRRSDRTSCLGQGGGASRSRRKALLDDRGQSTVEAAFVLPIVMLLLLMMLQPAICLYDHIVMRSAAAEGCRLLATSPGSPSTNEDYIRRRLSAIPDIDIFHVHSRGCSYDIEMAGDETASEVRVKITNKVKPLPLLDAAMSLGHLLGNGGTIEISAESSMPTQPKWVDHSAEGGSPKGWVSTL